MIGNQRDKGTQVLLPLDFGNGKQYFKPDEYEQLLKGGFNSDQDEITIARHQYKIYCLLRLDVLYLLRRMQYLYLCSMAKTNAVEFQLDKNPIEIGVLPEKYHRMCDIVELPKLNISLDNYWPKHSRWNERLSSLSCKETREALYQHSQKTLG